MKDIEISFYQEYIIRLRKKERQILNTDKNEKKNKIKFCEKPLSNPLKHYLMRKNFLFV